MQELPEQHAAVILQLTRLLDSLDALCNTYHSILTDIDPQLPAHLEAARAQLARAAQARNTQAH